MCAAQLTVARPGSRSALRRRKDIGATPMTINKAAVTADLITDDEFKAIMDTFKSALPADVVDPCSLGRIRNCTILPLAAAATVVRTFGRSPASMAWLRALSQPVPQAWELREEQEANDAAGEVDLLLNEKLDDANFEADESSFASELMTMPAFSADKEDEERLKTYILQRVPPGLKRELDIYLHSGRVELCGGVDDDAGVLGRQRGRGAPQNLHPSARASRVEEGSGNVPALSHRDVCRCACDTPSPFAKPPSSHAHLPPLRLGSSSRGWRGAVHLRRGRQHSVAALLWMDGGYQQTSGR